MVGHILNQMNSPRGDMSAYSEAFAHEDYFMQLARRNGEEVGTIDPTPAVGNHIKFLTKLCICFSKRKKKQQFIFHSKLFVLYVPFKNTCTHF